MDWSEDQALDHGGRTRVDLDSVEPLPPGVGEACHVEQEGAAKEAGDSQAEHQATQVHQHLQWDEHMKGEQDASCCSFYVIGTLRKRMIHPARQNQT